MRWLRDRWEALEALPRLIIITSGIGVAGAIVASAVLS